MLSRPRMAIATLRSAALACAVLSITTSPAFAQEASEPATGGDTVTTAIAPVTLHTGYQLSSHDSLQGLSQTLVLGFRLGRKDQAFQQFFEVGIGRLFVADSPVVTSDALIGGRLAWRWDRLAVHLMARFHHGDPATGNDGVAIYSHASSLGFMASFDVYRRGGRSMALALHGIGRLHDAADGEESTFAFAGDAGFSIIAW